MLPSSPALSLAMPRTISLITCPEGVCTVSVLPTARLVPDTYALLSTVPVEPSESSVAFEPRSHCKR